MEEIISVLLVFGVSAMELWAGIPLGLAANLNPYLIGISAALGAICSAFGVSFLGDNLRNRFIKKHYGKDKDIKKSRISQIWIRYGVIGLGLLSPLLFGAPLGTAVGIALGAEKKHLLIWISIGIIIWSAFLTTAGYMGLISLK